MQARAGRPGECRGPEAPRPAGRRDMDRQRPQWRRRPAQKTVLGQTGVDDVDSRRRQIITHADSVECTVGVVCHTADSLGKCQAPLHGHRLRTVYGQLTTVTVVLLG